MNLYLMLSISIGFVIINYFISSGDVVDPSFLFSAMNFLYLCVCCISNNIYCVVIKSETVCILSSGMLIFTLVSILFRNRIIKHQKQVSYAFEQIKISNIHFLFFYFIMAICAISMANNITRTVNLYGGGASGFVQAIGMYDDLAKFSSYNITVPTIYSYGSFIVKASAYILLAVLINNYYASKKIDIKILCFLICYLAFSLLTGGRSEIIRYLMAAVVILIICKRKQIGSLKKGNFKLLIKLIAFSVAIVFLSFVLLNLLGKEFSKDKNLVMQLLYKYIGGPIFNLNDSLDTCLYSSDFWGQETFSGVYSFIGNVFGVEKYKYSINIPLNFINGIDLGNVYTTYYMFLEDFGYWGLFLTCPIALFYYNSYAKLMDFSKPKCPLGINLFVYSFMFNSLIMLLFSNRFFEDMFSWNFVKFYFSLVFVWYIVKHVKCKFVTRKF